MDEFGESVFNGVYDNLGEAGLFVIRTIYLIRRIFGLCFWNWGLYVVELGYDFCMTNVRMYIKKGYGGLVCAYAHMRTRWLEFDFLCTYVSFWLCLIHFSVMRGFSAEKDAA